MREHHPARPAAVRPRANPVHRFPGTRMSHRLPLLLTSVTLAAACSTPTAADLAGQWGADHVNLTLADTGGTVEFDCAYGSIAPAWTFTPEGRFTASGHYATQGGPQAIQGPPPHPARYEGRLRGSTLTLTITLMDTNTKLGPFALERGRTAILVKCV